MYKIAVLMKQIPDFHGHPVFNEDGTLDRTSQESICNPCDMLALEMALSVKDSHRGAHITVLSMGPMSATEILKEGLYRGADEAILLSDKAFAGADTLATSRVLAAALKNIEPDIILCGDYSMDGGTSQVGPEIATMLGIPDVRSAISLKRARRREHHIGVSSGIVTVSGPVLVCVSDRAPQCRPCNIRLYMDFSTKPSIDDTLKIFSAQDLGLSTRKVGVSGSGTFVKYVTPVVQKEKGRVVTDDIDTVLREVLK